MAEFCYAFAGLSPRDYWELDEPEYYAMRALLERVHKKQSPSSKEVSPFAAMVQQNG